MTPEEYAEHNIERKLKMVGLYPYIEKYLLVMHDRIFFRAKHSFGAKLKFLVASDVMKKGFQSGGPHDAIYRLTDPSGIIIKDRKSYRENARPSLQIVVGRANSGYYYGDADIDLGSPSMDVVSFFTHMAELLTTGPTNHKQLKKKLDKQYEKWRRG